MIVLLILLILVWLVCVNAILDAMKTEYEDNKRKFELFVNNDNSPRKLYPVKGNGQCSEQDFYFR